jgi:ABC transporter substrate binding protein
VSFFNDVGYVILNVAKQILIILCIISYQPARAESVRLAVLYPEVKGGYAKVFNNILDGVKTLDNADIMALEINKKTDIDDVESWLIENQAQTVLALGKQSYNISKKLKMQIPVTVGAIVATPNGYGGISMDGDPEIFFKHLQTLTPKVKRVYVVYSKKNTEWLIKIAKRAAAKRNIKLIAYEVDNLKQGIKYYNNILNKVESHVDAIWIPLDRVVPDKAVLPKVLKVAWEKNIVIFSNNPMHAKKGSLFALFPDHKLMGRKLAEIAVNQVGKKEKYKLYPTSNLKTAVNRRTASHLGLIFSKHQQRQFDIVFPIK